MMCSIVFLSILTILFGYPYVPCSKNHKKMMILILVYYRRDGIVLFDVDATPFVRVFVHVGGMHHVFHERLPRAGK